MFRVLKPYKKAVVVDACRPEHFFRKLITPKRSSENFSKIVDSKKPAVGVFTKRIAYYTRLS